VKVKGHWRHLYRAIDKEAPPLTSIFQNGATRRRPSASFAAALKRSRDWISRVISSDKNPVYGEAIGALKKEGAIPPELEHRQAKYLNNPLEGDHGQLKRLIRPTLGFKSMRTARATINGFEVMRMFRKGQFRLWIEAADGGTEVSFVNWLLGLYAARPNFCNSALAGLLADLATLTPNEAIAAAGEDAARHFINFFIASIRNRHTRRSYARQAELFLSWCQARGLRDIREIRTEHIAAYIERLSRSDLEAASVKRPSLPCACSLRGSSSTRWCRRTRRPRCGAQARRR
jgi:hypothetical protein